MNATRTSSAFRSICQAARACGRSRAVQPTQLSRVARRQQRGYATEQPRQTKEKWEMDTPNKSGNLPLLIGAGALFLGGALYTISSGQKDVKHNDHAGQAGGEFTQGREQQGNSHGGLDQRKDNMPSDSPNKPENLAVSEEKMETKAPSKKVDPLK